MFYEYAVDPAALNTWDRARYFLDALGPWKGRFLAEYPRRWKRMVFESLHCPDVEKKKIVERLSQLDARVFSARAGAVYDGSRSWLENARTEHTKSPFRAIVSADVIQADAEVLPVDVDERNGLWCTQQGQLIPREPAAFAEALRVLLAASRRVAFVDPYFRADHAEKLAVLVCFCRLVAGRSAVVFDVHVSAAELSHAEQQRHAQRVLPRNLPVASSVTMFSWLERAGGARFHNRYLLTDIGGVQFGDGLERGGAGQHDRVSILSEPDRAHLWSQFYGEALAFDAAGPAVPVCGAPRATK